MDDRLATEVLPRLVLESGIDTGDRLATKVDAIDREVRR